MMDHQKSIIAIILMLLLFVVAGCTTYRSVICETNDIQEINKAQVVKSNVNPGEGISLVANGIRYDNFIVAKLDIDTITIVRNIPQSYGQNYWFFRYENLDSLIVKKEAFIDVLGIPVTLVIVVFFLLA